MNRQFLEQKQIWLQEQPQEIQRNTLLVETLAKYLDQNSPEYVASYLADCLKNRVWEDGFWDVRADGTFYIWTAENALDFIRERFKMEPATLMNIVASPLPKAEDGAAAAIELIKQVKANEPETFSVLLDKENARNWRDLLSANEKREGGPWIQAAAELDKASLQGKGGDAREVDQDRLNEARELYEQHKSYRKVGELMGVSSSTIGEWIRGVGAPRLGERLKVSDGHIAPSKIKDKRQRIRRKLERYAASPELCIEKNTTVPRVKAALIDFHNGTSAAQCEREAGLATPKNRHVQIHAGTEASKAASDLIKYTGADKAQAIADAILIEISQRAVS